MLREADAWIGKRLFVPPIIRFCQVTGMTQHAFCRYGWMVAGLWLIGFSWYEMDWVMKAIMITVCVFQIAVAALSRPEGEEPDRYWLRAFLWLSMLIDVIGVFVIGAGEAIDLHDGFTIIALFAEYAATIKTIPPKETKEAKRKLATQGG